MNNWETGEDAGKPSENAVVGVFGFLAMKDLSLGVRDVRGLLNVRKQLSSEEIREVKVTWVDSSPDPSAING